MYRCWLCCRNLIPQHRRYGLLTPMIRVWQKCWSAWRMWEKAAHWWVGRHGCRLALDENDTCMYCCDSGDLVDLLNGSQRFVVDVLSFSSLPQLLQQLKRLICDLCRLYNLPQHPDVEMLDQPLPTGPITQERKVLSWKRVINALFLCLASILKRHICPLPTCLITAAWAVRWGDIWRGRRGRNGRGSHMY